ncbi:MULTISPECIES: Rne/Rng family ribonuclease [unclassified Arthrobacter]|uniref:Rne/Rng family ribonuclease n=1 Tax=unclassified Arthrobacter TaxID=235627 RepID=UPI001E5A229B|nr:MULTISPECIES: Rne/Rng family ribonuclease [unclassified Arthrobacter]MCC9145641.1 Rne/Rng family ribonuclease [Arthrobacter sp. zg-Y919]MDK1276870.1 Rne/Rng family ribonuclease [Arthrobacter sp. zg.Y919]WIB04195.1 Rne/Rng family ribonuclease [Arthrobacter sp. zg-Y919]
MNNQNELTSELNAEAASVSNGQEAVEEQQAPVKKATRSRRKSVPASSPAEPQSLPVDAAAAETPAAETPAKPKRTRAPRKKAAPAAEAPAAPEETPEAVAESASAAADSASADLSTDAAPAEAAPAKTVRRRRSPAKKATAEPVALTESEAAGEVTLAAGPESTNTAEPAAEAPAPKTRTRRRASTPSGPARSAESAAGAGAAEAAAEPVLPAAAQEDAPVQDKPQDKADAKAEAAGPTSALDPFSVPESPTSVLFHAPDLTSVRSVPVVRAAEPEETEEEDTTEEPGRSRRRSRRGRSRQGSDTVDSGSDAAADDSPAGPADNEADGVTSRRRRRRRRGDADLELTGGADDDPPNTVTRVRAPRAHADAPVSDRVTSVKGSTRLEAKKQRRRESRESGRRRHVITEAEFLARRESVDRQMIVRQRDERIQIGVLEDGVLAEHFVSNTQQDSLIGNVYVGKVQNVLPSMEAAFVDIGRGRNAVLYAGEVNWDAAGLDGQPRRIELALKSGDSVLVQVTKDPVGHKGARLTSQISLPGRYLVYVPGGSMTGISRKLPDVERNRLKKILKDHLPENAGVIVRTAAEGASEEELMNDINRLRAQWENIEAKSKSTKTLPPELLYGEPDLTIKVVRDVFNEDFSKLVVSGEEAWDTIEAYVTYVAPDLVGRLEKWTKDEDIFSAHRIDEQIAKALDRKVFLPSGGSLVIDRTEAMTVVDVNTGKFTGSGGNLEETVTKNNLEAAEEVVRQLRLRDIGGIIVIDFIDMVLEANRDLVLRRLVECLGRDRTKHQVAEVTSLGLVQMTRKRMGTGLLEVFGETCEHCEGRGVVTQDVPVEHRRSTSHTANGHAVADDNHQQHLKQEKQSRGDRKRNRSRGQNGNAPAVEEAAQQDEPVQEDAERQAKAEAARAALASIAAATAAAHEVVDAAVNGNGGAAEPAAGDQQVDDSGTEPGAVLNIQGENVVVPRRQRRRPVKEEPTLTLESLTEAFNEVASAVSSEQKAPQSAAPPAAQTSQPDREQPDREQETPARPARRRRAASSPQGAAEVTAPAAGESAPSATVRHTATAAAKAQVAPEEKTAAPAPVILGVGVPASEL